MTVDARENSASALSGITRAGVRDHHRRLILEAVLSAPGTARELSERIGIDKQGCTARCSELKTERLLQEIGGRENVTGRKATLLGPTESTRLYLGGGWSPPARKRASRAELMAVVEAVQNWRQDSKLDNLTVLLEALDRAQPDAKSTRT